MTTKQLITETNFNCIKEIFYESDKLGKKSMYVYGPFIQTECVNRNGRIYPKNIMEECVRKYELDRMGDSNQLRTFGELGHPEGVEINLERVSHLITELKWQGNDVFGKAKLIPTEYGKIAQTIIESGGQLGVSSRGLGALDESYGQDAPIVSEYDLVAVDIVADPSAPKSFVKGILENKQYILGSDGVINETSNLRTEKAFTKLEEAVKTLPKKNMDEFFLKVGKNFLDTL